MDKLYHFIINPNNDYLGHTLAYIELCLASIILATVIGVVLGVSVSRSPVLAFIAVNVSGLMRAIPVIAFIVAVLPYLGLGFLPALIALTILGIPPILLNTYTGIRGINPATIDAARGMGMTTGQIITRIQAPLVLPIIAAGVRTSAVQIIATATLAAIIGAGGYGEYILSGLYQLDNVQILAGAIPVAILALIAEVLLSQLQRALTPAGLRVREIS
ncbi:MAG: ABC transporter permease [Ktedonobacteraceae bacterium]|nr:ABC transporter permease [Ktedonobacteraceae bacterium]MBV9615837.1 ABC transporter permease [Ktedonobacteraceae bacterium]